MQIIVFLIHISYPQETRTSITCKILDLVLFPSSPTFITVLIIQSLSFQQKKYKKLVPSKPASSDELACKLLKLCSGQALFNVLGTRGISRDERQRDLGLQNRSDSIYTIYTLSIEQIGFLLVSLQSFLIVSDITDPKYMWRYVNHESSWPLARLKAPS